MSGKWGPGGAEQIAAENYARRVVEQLTGLPKAVDDHVAWVIKCERNGRYYHSTGPIGVGPLTVARIHCRRYTTKAEAVAEWAAITRACTVATFRVVRLVTRVSQKQNGAGAQDKSIPQGEK